MSATTCFDVLTSRLGSELSAEDQRHVLASYVHRFTREHRPVWSMRGLWSDNKPYPVQFASDAEWLAHTRFATTISGRLDRRFKGCNSSPTWPDNPELRLPAGITLTVKESK